MMPVDLVGFGMIFAVLATLAVLVKYERKFSRWLVKSPRRRRRKAVGSRKDRASVSFGSAGAGEERFRNISRTSWFLIRTIGFAASE